MLIQDNLHDGRGKNHIFDEWPTLRQNNKQVWIGKHWHQVLDLFLVKFTYFELKSHQVLNLGNDNLILCTFGDFSHIWGH